MVLQLQEGGEKIRKRWVVGRGGRVLRRVGGGGASLQCRAKWWPGFVWKKELGCRKDDGRCERRESAEGGGWDRKERVHLFSAAFSAMSLADDGW